MFIDTCFVSDKDSKRRKGDTHTSILHLAAEHGHVGIAEALLRAGANVLKRDYRGKKPVDVAKTRLIAKILEGMWTDECTAIHISSRV